MKLAKIPKYIKHRVLLFLEKVQNKRRIPYLKKRRNILKNKDFTLISNNCNGGVLLHDLGIRFNSQFVNLFLSAEDYIKYLERFDFYNGLKLTFVDEPSDYPIAKLEDLTVHFVHYKSNEEAESKWEERKKRINKENMFIIFTEQKGCTPDLVERFDKLQFKNKVVFTYREYKYLKSAVFVKKYKNNPLGVHMFLEFKNHFSNKRNFDVFDFVSWFNGDTDVKNLIKQ